MPRLRTGPRRLILAGAGLFTLLSTLFMAMPANAATGGHPAPILNVSAHLGHNTPRCGSKHDPCLTIQFAVAKAAPGSFINVQPGTYHGEVVLTKTLYVLGDHATLDASGQTNGFAVGGALPKSPPSGPLPPSMAAGSVVRGFTVQHALGEGILVLHTYGVTIAHNTVQHNDLGAGTPATIECANQGEIPGDCGEGIHLLSSWNSRVLHNRVFHGQGGVLITDEVGPAFHNLVAYNRIANNGVDCGVTMPSHNGNAFTHGVLHPSVAGVYGNWVVGNYIWGNGGAGALMAVPFPGTASYNNVVTLNHIWGNGNSGVTLHAHAPAQYLNGNRILSNWIGRNNLAGDPDAANKHTTGVLVFSAVVPVQGTLIAGNTIAGNHFGVWLNSHVITSAKFIRTHNRFVHDDVRVFVAP